MSEHMTKYSAANLLEKLGSKGLAPGEELSDFVIGQQQEKELPLYLRVLVGVGALIASFFFIFFLGGIGFVIDYFERGIIFGLAFVAIAIGLQRVACYENTVKHSLFMQSSFSVMAVGKALFVLGMNEMLDSGWGVTLGLIIITGITYHIYRMSIDRFLSSFAVLFSILVNILWDRDVSSSRELLLNGFFLLQFAGAAILLTHGKIKRDYIPLSYAFTFSLCASVLFLASHAGFEYWRQKELIHPAFINMVLTVGLVALLVWTAGGVEKIKTKPIFLGTISSILLGLISAPGILLTIGLMVLGYSKHEKLLIITGALFMPIFLLLYYYNLDISLLEKSGILIGSGIMLLAMRIYLKYEGWDKRDL